MIRSEKPTMLFIKEIALKIAAFCLKISLSPIRYLQLAGYRKQRKGFDGVLSVLFGDSDKRVLYQINLS